eukprot:347016-Chlamydomonas_euryale.AAC.2
MRACSGSLKASAASCGIWAALRSVVAMCTDMRIDWLLLGGRQPEELHLVALGQRRASEPVARSSAWCWPGPEWARLGAGLGQSGRVPGRYHAREAPHHRGTTARSARQLWRRCFSGA